jgi:uncharacterized protein (TIGR00106 family)
MAIMEINVMPLGLGTPGMGDYIADLERYLLKENIPHKLTDMATVVEGDVATLLKVAQALHELPFHKGVQRVFTRLAIDDRRDKVVHLEEKTKRVLARLT